MDTPPKPDRRKDGTFSPNTSGNPQGRPKKSRLIPHPSTVRDMHYDVAELRTAATVDGKRYKLNLLQLNLLTLALAGASGDRAAAREFIRCIRQCSEQELRIMNQLTERFRHIRPSYLDATDPAERKRLLATWREILAEANGQRTKTTRGFSSQRRRSPE